MSKVVVVSNLSLCKGDFFLQLKRLCKAGIWGFVLREKELSATNYQELLAQSSEICKDYGVEFFAHSFVSIACDLGCKNIQFPLKTLLLHQDKIDKFSLVATSVHSMDEAKLALKHGANMLVAGHIFETECKKYLAPKGTQLLNNIRQITNQKLFAIGGINSLNFKDALKCGADGVCIMSSAMNCFNEKEFLKPFLS